MIYRASAAIVFFYLFWYCGVLFALRAVTDGLGVQL